MKIFTVAFELMSCNLIENEKQKGKKYFLFIIIFIIVIVRMDCITQK